MALRRRPGRSSWRLKVCVLVILAVLLAGALAKILFDAARQAQPKGAEAQRSIPNTDVNPFGANFFLTREVEPWKLERTLQMASDAGIGWVKQQFAWEEIEPSRKGEFLDPVSKQSSWTKYDQIVAACDKYGLRIVARLDRPPDWSRADNTYKERPPDRMEDYGDFVYEFVKRYEGRIDYVQIWNEPNIFPEWGNRPVDPAGYVEMLRIAYRRAKEANPNVRVLCAPLAPTLGQPHPEPGKWTAMNDLQYLEEMYKAGASRWFDIFVANAFGMDRPPEDPPDPAVLNLQRVALQRRVMERYGDNDKAVWFNEYGWNAAPPSMPQERLIWQRVSEQEQADYTLRGIELARREWPWAGVFMIWYMRQVGNIPADRADHYFRMVDPDFTPRLVYLVVQEASKRYRSAGSGLHQETAPSVKLSGRWRTLIDEDASGQGCTLSTTAGDSATLVFRGTSLDLLTRLGPRGGRLIVALDDRPVAGLPTTPEGSSYVELYAPTVQQGARVSLVRDAGGEDHTLRLTVSGVHHPQSVGSECLLDAFDVNAVRAGGLPYAAVTMVLIALGLDIWLLWRTWRRVRWIVRR